ncbi:hypothetical protein KKE60_06375 [Patescibacteria group bacterium]|nr:hypothetical protein [Patescibacteria group bacterium]
MTKFTEIIKQVTSNKMLLESTFTVDSTPITSIKHYKDKLYYFPIINQAKTLVNFCPHSYNVWIPKEGRGVFPPVMGSAVTYMRDQVSVFHTSKDRLDNPGGWATSKGGMIHEFWHIISGRIHNIDSSYTLPTNHIPHPDYPALFDHVPYNLL